MRGSWPRATWPRCAAGAIGRWRPCGGSAPMRAGTPRRQRSGLAPRTWQRSDRPACTLTFPGFGTMASGASQSNALLGAGRGPDGQDQEGERKETTPAKAAWARPTTCADWLICLGLMAGTLAAFSRVREAGFFNFD